jgi:hypothetical protein
MHSKRNFKDWREMFDKEHKNFDAVSVATHNHAIQTLALMQGKHFMFKSQ